MGRVGNASRLPVWTVSARRDTAQRFPSPGGIAPDEACRQRIPDRTRHVCRDRLRKRRPSTGSRRRLRQEDPFNGRPPPQSTHPERPAPSTRSSPPPELRPPARLHREPVHIQDLELGPRLGPEYLRPLPLPLDLPQRQVDQLHRRPVVRKVAPRSHRTSAPCCSGSRDVRNPIELLHPPGSASSTPAKTAGSPSRRTQFRRRAHCIDRLGNGPPVPQEPPTPPTPASPSSAPATRFRL